MYPQIRSKWSMLEAIEIKYVLRNSITREDMLSLHLVLKQRHVAPHSFRSLTGSRRVDPALGGAKRPKIRILAAMHKHKTSSSTSAAQEY